jgi:hypothetical protein
MLGRKRSIPTGPCPAAANRWFSFGERAFAHDQERKAVAELVGRFQAAGPLEAGQAPLFRIEAHQPQLRAQEVAEPLRGDVAHVIGADLVVPDAHFGR